jgi:lipoprotein signal peptidase
MASDGVSVVITVKVNTILYSGKKAMFIRWLVTFFLWRYSTNRGQAFSLLRFLEHAQF